MHLSILTITINTLSYVSLYTNLCNLLQRTLTSLALGSISISLHPGCLLSSARVLSLLSPAVCVCVCVCVYPGDEINRRLRGQTDRPTDRQTNRQTDRQTKQADRQTDRQTDRAGVRRRGGAKGASARIERACTAVL